MKTSSHDGDVFCDGFVKNVQDNQLKIDFFLDLSEELKKSDVPILPLKGLDLLFRAYPTLGLRTMADIDLLIRKEDILTVKSALEKKGFQRIPDEGLTYLSPDKKINLDIVWDIWYLPDTTALWKRTVKRIFREKEWVCLHPEDALIYNLVFTVAHRGILTPLFAQDLEFFLEREQAEIDWPRLYKTVLALKFKIPFYRGFSYAQTHGTETLPADWLPRFQPSNSLEEYFARYYELMTQGTGSPKVSYLFTWFSYPGLAGKWKLLKWSLLPSRSDFEMRFGETSRLSYLIHLLFRPFLLVLKGILLGIKDFFLLLIRQRREP